MVNKQKNLCLSRGLNPGLLGYKPNALPTELLRPATTEPRFVLVSVFFWFRTRLKSVWSKTTVRSTSRKNILSQSGRVVYGAAFKLQSALRARVRILPLTSLLKNRFYLVKPVITGFEAFFSNFGALFRSGRPGTPAYLVP